MDNIETDIYIPRLSTKMISNLNNFQDKIKENSFCEDSVKVFQCNLYIMKKKKKIEKI